MQTPLPQHGCTWMRHPASPLCPAPCRSLSRRQRRPSRVISAGEHITARTFLWALSSQHFVAKNPQLYTPCRLMASGLAISRCEQVRESPPCRRLQAPDTRSPRRALGFPELQVRGEGGAEQTDLCFPGAQRAGAGVSSAWSREGMSTCKCGPARAALPGPRPRPLT